MVIAISRITQKKIWTFSVLSNFAWFLTFDFSPNILSTVFWRKYFFGIFGKLCFLKTPVLRFALLPCYRFCICVTSRIAFIAQKIRKYYENFKFWFEQDLIPSFTWKTRKLAIAIKKRRQRFSFCLSFALLFDFLPSVSPRL